MCINSDVNADILIIEVNNMLCASIWVDKRHFTEKYRSLILKIIKEYEKKKKQVKTTKQTSGQLIGHVNKTMFAEFKEIISHNKFIEKQEHWELMKILKDMYKKALQLSYKQTPIENVKSLLEIEKELNEIEELEYDL